MRVLTDKLGNLTDTSSYDAYGNVTDPLSAEFGYRGESFEDLTRLQYLRARYYEPSTGRFLGVDPFEGDVNSPVSRHRYLYGNANPISYADPSGKFASLGELTSALSIQSLLLTYASLQLNIFQFLAGRAVTTQGSIEWTGDYYSAGIVPGALASSLPINLLSYGAGWGGGLMVLDTDGAGATSSYTKGLWLILGGLITVGPLPLSATGSSTTILSPAQWGTDIKNLSGGFFSFGGGAGGGLPGILSGAVGYSITMMGFGVGQIANNASNPFYGGIDASITGFTGISIPLWQKNN